MNPARFLAPLTCAIAVLIFVETIIGQSNNDVIAGVRAVEQQRIKAIEQVIGSVIAVYGDNRQGGGSGVIIDPSGIALTNHHVIAGAGVRGFGGLDDGKLYPWTLIGTDPGGDVAVIQMTGRDRFPCSPLGDSDTVEQGDWALAMGNPFLLAEDQTPTVTLGIVSGVKRYQPGAGANQLVYGNCIQVDSSINPGNSGGPLFNLAGEVIGINGRGSFQDRGRVNVGLGYAISSNQIKNFLPDLLATKLTEHATLDASFGDRDRKVVCSQIDRLAPIAQQGLSLGDELLEFEGVTIRSANQFTNLICTLPEDWPATLKIRKPNGDEQTLRVRTFGLPYPKQPRPKKMPPPGGPAPDGEEAPAEEEPSDPQQKKQQENLKQQMIALLATPPGTVRDQGINLGYADQFLRHWVEAFAVPQADPTSVLRIESELKKRDADQSAELKTIGKQTMWLASDGRCRVVWDQGEQRSEFWFDRNKFGRTIEGKSETISRREACEELPLLQALTLAQLVAAADADTNKSPINFRQRWLIDGAGKSNEELAWRYRLAEDQQELYAWFGVTSRRHGLESMLHKVAANRDNELGAVRFEQWQSIGGFQLPKRITFVESLAETELLRIETLDVSWTDAMLTFEQQEDNVDE